MLTEDFARLPVYSVVDTENWLMVKTHDNCWAPVGCETFDATDEEMATMTYHERDKLYFDNPVVVAIGGTNV